MGKKVLESSQALSATAAAQAILNGGVIIYPTETVYGLGANALNIEAVEKVFEIKQRDRSKPILVLVPDEESLDDLVMEVPEVARLLIRVFWPGALTLVFKAAPVVSPILTANSGKIGIRLSSSEFCKRLLNICKIPITSTSANLSGEPNPTSIDEINKTVRDAVDLIIDGGSLESGKPSTVVDVSSGEVRLVREGVINFDEIIARLAQ
ncbi:MAG: L-threonylcarbamoyladenylate synthase [Candidatus Kryptoniota bacterium]